MKPPLTWPMKYLLTYLDVAGKTHQQILEAGQVAGVVLSHMAIWPSDIILSIVLISEPAIAEKFRS